LWNEFFFSAPQLKRDPLGSVSTAMRHLIWKNLAVPLLAFVAMACGDSTSPGGPVSGSWRNDTTLSTLSTPLTVRLTQRDTVIEGSGMYGGATPAQVSVIGFYSSLATPNPVILTFAAVNTVPAILFGHLSSNGDTLSGEYRWTLASIPSDTVVFVRQ